MLWFLLAFPVVGWPAEPAAQFDAANKLYEQGEYREAIAAYRDMVRQGAGSAAVYFNLGNAHYKAEEIGLAVASYRLAERIAPRDPDIQANLRFVQEEAGIRSGLPVPWWQAWTRRVSLREWAILTALAVWVMAIFGVLRTIRPGWKAGMNVPMFAAVVLVLWTSTGATLAWHMVQREQAAVVRVNEAVVRYGPLDDSQSAFTLRDGAEVVITDKKDDWWQVRDGQGRTGWVKDEAIAQLDELVP